MYTLSHSHTHSLSHTHPHTYTHTRINRIHGRYAVMPVTTRCFCMLEVKHAHTHTITHTRTHTSAHIIKHLNFLSLSLSRSLCISLYFFHAHTHTHIQSQRILSLSRSLSPPLFCCLFFLQPTRTLSFAFCLSLQSGRNIPHRLDT